MTLALFTDLDGTLLGSDQTLSPVNRKALERLGGHGITRVVVTGRSLYSTRRVLDRHFPIDLLVTSSGAGIFSFPDLDLLASYTLTPAEVSQAVSVLLEYEMDFMIHDPVPDNHRFRWHRCSARNQDFDRRLSLYDGHHQPMDETLDRSGLATQLLAICSAGEGTALHGILQDRLSDLTVIRTTSPLDHQSIWYEIFPSIVSKSSAAAWICRENHLDADSALAVGNDYNDLDLLHWATHARVVANAPAELTDCFQTVADFDQGGFGEAVYAWLEIGEIRDRIRPPGGLSE